MTGKTERKIERKPKTSPTSVVIIGAGAAGGAAAEMLRREGYDGPVTLIGADDSLPYDRPNLSKDYLAGNAPEEWIPLRPPEFYREQKIDAFTNTTVTSIDPKTKQVTLSEWTFVRLRGAIAGDGCGTCPSYDSRQLICRTFFICERWLTVDASLKRRKPQNARSSLAPALSDWKWRGRYASVKWRSQSSEEIRCRSGKFWEPKWEIWFAKRTKRMA